MADQKIGRLSGQVPLGSGIEADVSGVIHARLSRTPGPKPNPENLGRLLPAPSYLPASAAVAGDASCIAPDSTPSVPSGLSSTGSGTADVRVTWKKVSPAFSADSPAHLVRSLPDGAPAYADCFDGPQSPSVARGTRTRGIRAFPGRTR